MSLEMAIFHAFYKHANAQIKPSELHVYQQITEKLFILLK